MDKRRAHQSCSAKEKVIVVEDMPSFPTDKYTGFRDYVANELNYPEQAVQDSIQGKVVTQFIVSRNGYIKNIHIVQSVHPLLDREARRVLEDSPRWTPGYQKGRRVNVQFRFPIIFAL